MEMENLNDPPTTPLEFDGKPANARLTMRAKLIFETVANKPFHKIDLEYEKDSFFLMYSILAACNDAPPSPDRLMSYIEEHPSFVDEFFLEVKRNSVEIKN
jgi:hypothetical protein